MAVSEEGRTNRVFSSWAARRAEIEEQQEEAPDFGRITLGDRFDHTLETETGEYSGGLVVTVWYGGEGDRMILGQDQVRQLRDTLTRWLGHQTP